MKKILCVILCALLVTVPLCACGKGENEPSGSDVYTQTDSEEKWIDVRFSEAERVYAWFTGCEKPTFDANDFVEQENGAKYVRVTEPGLNSTDDLYSLVDELFTPEVAETLEDAEVYSGAPMFIDRNGGLYCFRDVTGQVPYDIGERIGTVDSQSDTEIVYRVDITYDYYASSFAASLDYHLVKGEDGNWRFMNFQLPALLIAERMFLSDED